MSSDEQFLDRRAFISRLALASGASLGASAALSGCATTTAPAQSDVLSYAGPTVSGTCHRNFLAVANAFHDRFAEGKEIGASLCIYHRGAAMVDLWGGIADAQTGAGWERDTVATLMSTTKGLTYTCIHLLAQRGRIDLDAPVASYWPEFAAHGKSKISVRSLMAHRGGIPALDRPVGYRQLLEWEPVIEAIADQTPLWEPDTAHGYHPLTTGWALSEIIRRVDGRRAREFFAQEIAQPLSLNLSIGNRDPQRRIARMAPPGASLADGMERFYAAMGDPSSIPARSFSTPQLPEYNLNSPETHALEMPSGNGMGDASSLAKLYASLIGAVDGERLLSQTTTEAAMIPQASGDDLVVLLRTDFASGYALPGGPLFASCPPGSFGHGGAGGSLGFADPSHELAFGYVMNQMSPGLGATGRTTQLIAAAYDAITGR